jgi:hypothetical protein
VGVKVSQSCVNSMECSGILMAGLSSSCSGSIFESVYGRFRIFVFFIVGFSEVVSKSNYFFDV